MNETSTSVQDSPGSPEQDVFGEAHEAASPWLSPGEAEAKPSSGFTPEDQAWFEAEDGHAGRAIGKMLSFFFLYTVIVMSLAAWWTFRSVFGW